MGLRTLGALGLWALVLVVSALFGQESDGPVAVEYYYKARWGHAQEFLDLYKRNHYPILQRQIEQGRLVRVTAVRPLFHAPESGRWDYKVTIVYKNWAALRDSSGQEELIRQLYPDQKKFQEEERRRFQILEAHWDVPLAEVPLEVQP